MGPRSTAISVQPAFQHYAWGDDRFIPELYGLPVTGKPYAEAWFGAHGVAPSIARAGDGPGAAGVPLDRLIASEGAAILGPRVQERFAGLPYLVKILAAARPLSIQVHPSRAQAIAGFAREEAAGPPRDAPERRYRDPHAKPELIIALSTFSALCGFRPAEEIAAVLERAPEIAALLPPWAGAGTGAADDAGPSLRQLLRAYFALPDARLGPALRRWIDGLRDAPEAAPGLASRWILEADQAFSAAGRPDRGLFVAALLNFVELGPWEAMFLPAGVPHAYLRGAGIEIMSSSDNVLRAGLTPKPVDADELLAITRFECGRWPTLRPAPPAAGSGDPFARYATSAVEFAASRLEVGPGHRGAERTASGPELLLFVGAKPGDTLRVASGDGAGDGAGAAAIELGSGMSCLVPHGARYRISTEGGHAGVVVRTAVPEIAPLDQFRGRRIERLAFGTSGLRGLVTSITDLEAYVSTRGFLDHVTQIGDARPGGSVALAGDLRPSTDSAERSIMRAVARAITDAGFVPVNCGRIPTPALAHHALAQRWPSVMVTGSHIPFDRNGIKFFRSTGEVLKADEAPILDAVDRVRAAESLKLPEQSLFDDGGMFWPGARAVLPAASDEAARRYRQRYLDFFPPRALAGTRVVVYQHSAVGRHIVVEVLRGLGADVHPVGLTDSFVAIDTEAIAPERLREVEALAERARRDFGAFDAIVSTDGDSDRPMVLGVDAASGQPWFYGGDMVGMVVADYLGADALAVPVTATDAIEAFFGPRGVRTSRTRVGSPYVIAAMSPPAGARAVGWEANGGFMTFAEIERDGRRLAALPTRDAMLPIVAVLHAARARAVPLSGLFAELPRRFSRSGLIDGVPVPAAHKLMAMLQPAGVDTAAPEVRQRLRAGVRAILERHFDAAGGFGAVADIDFLDGVRVRFEGDEVAHIRPSGNAPQLRIYALAGSDERARAIVDMALAEPDGILRRLLSAADAADAGGAV